MISSLVLFGIRIARHSANAGIQSVINKMDPRVKPEDDKEQYENRNRCETY